MELVTNLIEKLFTIFETGLRRRFCSTKLKMTDFKKPKKKEKEKLRHQISKHTDSKIIDKPWTFDKSFDLLIL